MLPRYEKLPLDYRAPFLLTLEPPGPLPLVSGRSASSSLASLSRYLYHQRWLWSVPSGLAPALPLSAIAQLLSILTEYVTQPTGPRRAGREQASTLGLDAGRKPKPDMVPLSALISEAPALQKSQHRADTLLPYPPPFPTTW